MFRIVHSFSLAVLITLLWTCAGYAQSVPVTVDGSVPGLTGTVRNTCDPAIEEVIRNQAWEAAQREISQNANIYARPDSVLSLSCFDSWMDHQNWYANNNFPVNPDESKGKLLGGLMTDLFIILPDDIITSVDPNLTEGYVQYGILEILVLDQLVDVGSVTGKVDDVATLFWCIGDKRRHISNSFPGRMIGDRAKRQNPTPAYSAIYSGLGSSVNSSRYNCDMMNRVWQRTKCYDFATEDNEFYASGTAYTGGMDHDGFYTFKDYVSNEYRREPRSCALPSTTMVKIPSLMDLRCYLQAHGPPGMPIDSPTIPGFAWIGGASYTDPSGRAMTWPVAHAKANPPAGTPGAGDAMLHYWSLLSGDTSVPCAAPIRTGFVVLGESNTQYYDAVCPNPGCFYTAPGSLAGMGSCSR